VVAGLIAGASLGVSQRAVAEAPEGTDCLTVRGEARMQAYGYAHAVVVTNGCRREARCEVWTTADPTPRHRLVVRRGRPAAWSRASARPRARWCPVTNVSCTERDFG
jgi:hypothetical protein